MKKTNKQIGRTDESVDDGWYAGGYQTTVADRPPFSMQALISQ